MTEDERQIINGFGDLVAMLEYFNDPPPLKSPYSNEYWEAFTQSAQEYARKYHDHTLAIELAVSVMIYLETKQKASDTS